MAIIWDDELSEWDLQVVDSQSQVKRGSVDYLCREVKLKDLKLGEVEVRLKVPWFWLCPDGSSTGTYLG
jgi:hypothetical protein